MTEFIYSTESTVRGPWLLSRAELQDLDVLLESEWQKLITVELREAPSLSTTERFSVGSLHTGDAVEHQQITAASIEPKPSRPAARNITLSSSEQPVVLVSSFGEALRDPALLERVFRGFELDWQCGDVTLRIDLTRDRMVLRASPERNAAARELFAVLRQWQETHQPPRWQQLWRRAMGIQWVVLLVVFAVTSDSSEPANLTEVRQHARTLLDNGLTQDEVVPAIEALLRLQPGVERRVPDAHGAAAAAIVLLTVVLTVLLSIAPKTVLGIGSGETLIRRWKGWLRFVFYSIPSFLAATFLWPYLQELLRRLVAP